MGERGAFHFNCQSAIGQDEPNSALSLATRAGKMELSWALGITRYAPQVNSVPYNKSFFQQVRWLDMGLVLFLRLGP